MVNEFHRVLQKKAFLDKKIDAFLYKSKTFSIFDNKLNIVLVSVSVSVSVKLFLYGFGTVYHASIGFGQKPVLGDH